MQPDQLHDPRVALAAERTLGVIVTLIIAVLGLILTAYLCFWSR